MRNVTPDSRRILVANRNAEFTQTIRTAFEAAGYRVLTAESSREALRAIKQHGLPDLALVDVALKYRVTGYDLARKLQRFSDLPIIMTANQPNAEMAVYALDQFAEDFVALPVETSVLVARARRLLARFPGRVRRSGPMRIDFVEREVTVDDKIVKLTPTETKLLHILARRADETLSSDYLMRRLWPSEQPDASKLRVNMYRLRTKIGAASGSTTFIQSERGVGYSLVLTEVLPTAAA